MALDIRAQATKCFNILGACSEDALLKYDIRTERQRAAFILWASTTGAFSDELLSADYRLRKHVDLQRTVLDLLTDLLETVEQLLSISKHIQDSPNYVDIAQTSIQRSASALVTTTPTGSEAATFRLSARSNPSTLANALTSTFEEIETSINWLIKFAVAIRKSASRNRDSRVDKFTDKSDPGFHEFRDSTLELLRSFRISFLFREAQATRHEVFADAGKEPPALGHELLRQDDVAEVVKSLDDVDMSQNILQRIAEENVRRRKTFLYNRRHDSRFRSHPEPLQTASQIPDLLPAENKRNDKKDDPQKRADFITDVLPQDLNPAGRPSTVVGASTAKYTAASSIDSKKLEMPSQQPSRGKSLVSAPAAAVKAQYPPLPKDSKGNDSFKCPYCCLPVRPIGDTPRSREEWWRRHVKSDIRPYVCLMPNCSDPTTTFATKSNWIQHMDAEHRKLKTRWVCKSAGHSTQATFTTEKQFLDHMRDSHARGFTESMLPKLAERSALPAAQMLTSCILCGWMLESANVDKVSQETLRSLLNHIGEHLEKLALTALPGTGYADDKPWRLASESSGSATDRDDAETITSSEVVYLRDQPLEDLILDDPNTTETSHPVMDDVQSESADSREAQWGGIMDALANNVHILRGENRAQFVCPRLENMSFVHRESMFAHLEGKQIRSPGKMLLLLGASGSGKSELICKYAYRMSRHNRDLHIFWLPADDNSTLAKAYEEIAETCRIPGRHELGARLSDLVFSWLERNSNWLIIFDNFGPGNWTTWIPPDGKGSIIITSNKIELVVPKAIIGVDVSMIRPMNDKESTQLFRSNLPAEQTYNDEDILKLCRLAGGSPDLILSIATQIRRPWGSIPEFLRDHRERAATCLQSSGALDDTKRSLSRSSHIATNEAHEWLLNHHDYQEWARSHGLLVLTEMKNPGSKSLVKYAIEQSLAEAQTTRSDHITLSYSYSNDEGATSIYQSLLLQLLRWDESLLFRFEYSQWVSWTNYRQDYIWDEAFIKKHLREYLSRTLICQHVRVYIDAQDLPENRYFEFQDVTNLLEDLLGVSHWSGKNLMICAYTKTGLTWDFRTEVRQLRVSTSGTGADLETTPASIGADPPAGAHLDCAQVLARAALEDVPRLLSILTWVCFALRPLSVNELRWALSMNQAGPSLVGIAQLEDHIATEEDMSTILAALCGPMLSVEPTDGVATVYLKFPHFFRDYIVTTGLSSLRRRLGKTEISAADTEKEAQSDISLSCLMYLATEEVQDFAHNWNPDEAIDPNLHFLKYSIQYWLQHAAIAESQGISHNFDEWPSSRIISCWLRLYNFPAITNKPTARPPSGSNILHVAAREGLESVVASIVNYSYSSAAKIYVRDGNGHTALVVAATHGHYSIVRLLLHAMDNPMAHGDRDQLHLALVNAVKSYHHETVRLLLDSEADFNKIDSDGLTPLYLAAQNGHIGIVKLMLDHVAETDHFQPQGPTPLYAAASTGHIEIVSFLLEMKFDVNAEGGYYKTALLAAIFYNHRVVVQTLLENQADTKIECLYGHALNVAAKTGNVEILKLVGACFDTSRGYSDWLGRQPLHFCARFGRIEAYDYLIECGYDSGVMDRAGRSVISFASSSMSLAMVLKTIGASSVTTDSGGWHPLHWACRTGSIDVVRAFQTGKHLWPSRSEATVITTAPQGTWRPYDIAVMHCNESLLASIRDIWDLVRLKPGRARTDPDILRERIFLDDLGFDTAERTERAGKCEQICDSCFNDIYGPRFHCIECEDFDYCFMCNVTAETTHEHPLRMVEVSFNTATNVRETLPQMVNVPNTERSAADEGLQKGGTLITQHRDRLASQHALAQAYLANGQVKEAVSLLEHVVVVEKDKLQEDHPNRLASQHELAIAYLRNRQVKEAVSLLEHVVAVEKDKLQEDYPNRLASQHELARAYRANGQVKEAVSLLEHVRAVRKDRVLEDRPNEQQLEASLSSAQTETTQLRSGDYAVAWIVTQRTAYAVASFMLDERYQQPADFIKHAADHNTYIWGRMEGHDIVVALLDPRAHGVASGVTAASATLLSLPSIKFGVLVGVGGAIARPDEDRDIRLGDIAVGWPHGKTGGVIRYHQEGTARSMRFVSGDSLNPLPGSLISAIHRRASVQNIGNASLRSLESKDTGWAYPGKAHDRLFRASYRHVTGLDCRACDPAEEIPRHDRSSTEPRVHYGTIGTSDRIIKDAPTRDSILRALDNHCICLDNDATLVGIDFPCLVIRGICDYADSHEYVQWQSYAVATASAYANQILRNLSPEQIDSTEKLVQRAGSVPYTPIADVYTDPTFAGTELSEDYGRKTDTEAPIFNEKALGMEGSGDWRDEDAKNLTSYQHNLEAYMQARDMGKLGFADSFLVGEEFHHWRSNVQSVLWLHGSPGSGKTVVSSMIIEQLKANTTEMPLEILYFFFNAYDNTRQSLEHMIRCLTRQLQVANPGRSLADVPTEPDQLEKAFELASEGVSNIAIIIDSLEDSSSVRETIEWLRRQYDSTHGLSRLLITSRRELEVEETIKQWFPFAASAAIDPGNFAADGLIRRRLQTDKAFERWKGQPDVFNTIERVLVERSKGRLRWLAVQLDTLAACETSEMVDQYLASLPATLTESYDRIVQRIPESWSARVESALLHLAHADGPVRLDDLIAMIHVPLTPIPRAVYRASLLEALEQCSGMIVVQEKAEDAVDPNVADSGNLDQATGKLEVRLAHYSVRDYLRAKEAESHLGEESNEQKEDDGSGSDPFRVE